MAASQLDLARRAGYRRVLAILKATGCPFVVSGALAVSIHLGNPVEGPLEVFVRERDMGQALAALSAAGFRAEEDPGGWCVRVGRPEHVVVIAWRLPPPLLGSVDDCWLTLASRRTFVDLRVRIAPPEELIWLRLATGGEAYGDRVIDDLLLRAGATLDWPRLLSRIFGLEAELLSHIFAVFHRHPEEARHMVSREVIDTLLSRVIGLANQSADQPP